MPPDAGMFSFSHNSSLVVPRLFFAVTLAASGVAVTHAFSVVGYHSASSEGGFAGGEPNMMGFER